jgi:signal transduction histidine kinase
MLYEFINTYRDTIIAKTRGRVRTRPWPPASTTELEHGLPLFLTQLAETLRWESSATPFSATAIGASAPLHGRDLLALGFTVSQVVHDYGDICQAVTEVAVEQNAPITTEEFHTLNRCLDTAIAQAVTEHARLTANERATEALERLGLVTHEIRNGLNTALLAFDIVKRGTVGITGSTGAILGRSLVSLHDLVDSTLSEIRTAASHLRPERVAITEFLSDIALAAQLQAEYSGLEFAMEAVEPGLCGILHTVQNRKSWLPPMHIPLVVDRLPGDRSPERGGEWGVQKHAVGVLARSHRAYAPCSTRVHSGNKSITLAESARTNAQLAKCSRSLSSPAKYIDDHANPTKRSWAEDQRQLD